MNDLTLYYKYQKEIKTGDHLGWHSTGIIGKLIRLKTGGEINHSSMAYRMAYEGLEKRRYELGALNRGMEFHMLSKRLGRYDGEVYWYPLKPEYDELRKEIAVKGLEIVDTPYDYDSLFKNLICHVSTNAAKFFCSEAYNWILNEVGIDTGFPLGVGGKAPTPNDIDKYFKIFKDRVKVL